LTRSLFSLDLFKLSKAKKELRKSERHQKASFLKKVLSALVLTLNEWKEELFINRQNQFRFIIEAVAVHVYRPK